jgi:hypothetical protein
LPRGVSQLVLERKSHAILERQPAQRCILWDSLVQAQPNAFLGQGRRQYRRRFGADGIIRVWLRADKLISRVDLYFTQARDVSFAQKFGF